MSDEVFCDHCGFELKEPMDQWHVLDDDDLEAVLCYSCFYAWERALIASAMMVQFSLSPPDV